MPEPPSASEPLEEGVTDGGQPLASALPSDAVDEQNAKRGLIRRSCRPFLQHVSDGTSAKATHERAAMTSVAVRPDCGVAAPECATLRTHGPREDSMAARHRQWSEFLELHLAVVSPGRRSLFLEN
jgi:hypothetical protein